MPVKPPSLPGWQAGAVLTSCALCLTAIIAIAALYGARALSLQHRIQFNTNNHAAAKHAATTGLMDSYSQARFTQDLNQLNQAGVLNQLGSYQLNVSQTLVIAHHTPLKVLSLSSAGSSADQQAKAVWQEQALGFNLLHQLPIAPLIIAGGVTIDTRLTLVANPNGLGDGVPLSLWAQGPLAAMPVQFRTCGWHEWLHVQCLHNYYSSPQQINTDLQHSHRSFPATLINHYSHDLVALRDHALQRYSHCQQIDDMHAGLVWISGDCQSQFKQQMGSPQAPIWLVIHNGNLTLLDNTRIFGIVWLLSEQLQPVEVNVLGDAEITGSLLSEKALHLRGQSLTLVYHRQLLERLQAHPSMWILAVVPGSRRDY